MLLPMYPLSPGRLRGPAERSTPDSPRQWLSWRLPGIGSEIHARHPVMVQATCTFIPVVLRFAEYRSGCVLHDQHGSSVPSAMWHVPTSSSSPRGDVAEKRLYQQRGDCRDGAADRGLRDAVVLSDFRLDPVLRR